MERGEAQDFFLAMPGGWTLIFHCSEDTGVRDSNRDGRGLWDAAFRRVPGSLVEIQPDGTCLLSTENPAPHGHL